MIYHLDYETTSECDIGRGAFRYASDPSTRILMYAIAKDDEKPLVWDSMDPYSDESIDAEALYIEACESGAPIYAHNVQFEVAITHYLQEVKPDLRQWRCTASMCRRCGVPPSLAGAADFLNLGEDKDKRGKGLISVFSDRTILTQIRHGRGKAETKQKVGSPLELKPVPWEHSFTLAGEQVTVREGWELFKEYCRQDVVVEQAVHKALSKFEITGDLLEGFLFDLKMNVRGIPVDVPALKRAEQLIIDYERTLNDRFREITGLNQSQRDKCLAWFQEHGYKGDNLQAATVEHFASLEDSEMTPECLEAIQIKATLSFAAVKKVKAMIDWVCPDGRIRGAFIWHGAQKTGRWTSVGPQFQNMKKPPKWMKPLMAAIYRAVARWADNEELAFLFGNPFEVLACCSRYFVRDPDGPIYDVDFAQVEARILPALIEAERILDKFRRGEDIYLDVAKALNTDRDMGKVISLLCQFGGGWQAINLPDLDEAGKRRAVFIYRKENPEVVQGWNRFQDSFVEALENPGRWIQVTRHVKMAYARSYPFKRIHMRLPSGRDIIYPFPKADPMTMVKVSRPVKDSEDERTEKWERLMGKFYSKDDCHAALGLRGGARVESCFITNDLSFHGHVDQGRYGRVKTYGGDLLQSATQGTGMDFLMHGCVVAESRGFEPFFVVHDQALAKGLGGLEAFVEALCTRPSWFPDFPLEADGTIADSYQKD